MQQNHRAYGGKKWGWGHNTQTFVSDTLKIDRNLIKPVAQFYTYYIVKKYIMKMSDHCCATETNTIEYVPCN